MHILIVRVSRLTSHNKQKLLLEKLRRGNAALAVWTICTPTHGQILCALHA